MKTYLLSIKEEPFKSILRGIKRYEFRKKFSNIQESFKCLIYVTAPIKSIVGTIKFDKPIKENIPRLVSLAKKDNYPFIKSLKDYFKEKEIGYALPVKKIEKFDKEISLEELRKKIPNFMPPQSYYSIDDNKYSIIKSMIKNES